MVPHVLSSHKLWHDVDPLTRCRRYKQNKAWAPGVYKDDAEYFADVAKAYQVELQNLYDAGLRNVQFDDPGLAYFCSDVFRSGWAEDKDNIGTVDGLLDAYIKLYNDSIAKVPEDMHVGMRSKPDLKIRY